MGSGFLKKKKQARLFQEQLSQMQGQLSSKLEQIEVTGSAGNGLVEVTLNGSYEIKRLHIKKECVDPEDIDGLTALIKAAFHDATEQLKEKMEAPGADGLPDLSSLGLSF